MQDRHLNAGHYVLAISRAAISPEKAKVSENTKKNGADND